MSNECTTEDCGNHTATWLCGQCVSDLQQWIDKALLIMPEMDVTIARLDVTRPGNPETRNANHAGSAAPANLDALQLKLNMESIGPDAKVYALDPRAAGLAWLIQDWYTKAELLVSGPEEIHVNHAANKERVANIAPPMTTRHLVPWLRKNAKIAIMAKDIRNWAARGKLIPVERQPLPTYWPHEALQVHKETRE